jgi:hypothetical protein
MVLHMFTWSGMKHFYFRQNIRLEKITASIEFPSYEKAIFLEIFLL